MTNHMVALLSILFSPLALAASDPVRTLEQIVRERVVSETSDNKSLSSGRKILLDEMKKYPEQLAADIKRIPISIGGTPIKIGEDRQAREVFLLIAANLEKYLQEAVPAVKNNSAPGHIGPFSITEIIYAIVQNFMAPVTVRAYNKIGVGPNREWAPLSKKITLDASFKIAGKNILEVAVKSVQPLQNLRDPKAQKTLTLLSTIKFNFNTGAVTFEDAYKL